MKNIEQRLGDLSRQVAQGRVDAHSNGYLHGFANGLICAHATMLDIEPDYVELPETDTPSFENELSKLLNKHGKDADCGISDYSLAHILDGMLTAISRNGEDTTRQTGDVALFAAARTKLGDGEYARTKTYND